MPITVPNQKIVTIHRERATADFLGIKNENWMAAARDLGAHALMLYMYFAANRDRYSLALSPAAVFNAIGMPRSTYRDQLKKLENKGYLIKRGPNSYDFYEVPRLRSETKVQELMDTATAPALSDDISMSAVQSPPQPAQHKSTEDIEIDNINIKNKSINSDFPWEEWYQYAPECDAEDDEIGFPPPLPKKGTYVF